MCLSTCPPRLLDGIVDHRPEAVHETGDELGIQPLGQRREAGRVGEQHRRLAPTIAAVRHYSLRVELRPQRRHGHIDHLVGYRAAELLLGGDRRQHLVPNHHRAQPLTAPPRAAHATRHDHRLSAPGEGRSNLPASSADASVLDKPPSHELTHVRWGNADPLRARRHGAYRGRHLPGQIPAPQGVTREGRPLLPVMPAAVSHSGSYASTLSASTSDRRMTKSRLTPHVALWSNAACNSGVNAVTASKPSFS